MIGRPSDYVICPMGADFSYQDFTSCSSAHPAGSRISFPYTPASTCISTRYSMPIETTILTNPSSLVKKNSY